MKSFLEALDGQDLLISFGIGIVGGFLFYYANQYLLSKAESAVGIPASAAVI